MNKRSFKNRLLICPYCGKRAEYVDSKEVYGKSFGMIYLCRDCDAYVGVHRGTNKPMGTLANAELRAYRQQAHYFFDKLWRGSGYAYSRTEAYQWLARKMRLPIYRTHMGMFNIEQCKQVIRICQRKV